MKILIINSGSSSIKYNLYETGGGGRYLANGIVAKIGEVGSYVKHNVKGHEIVYEAAVPNHSKGFEIMIRLLTDPEYKILKGTSEIAAVGHRFVQGGGVFEDSVLITEEVIKIMEGYVHLAPLHTPPNLVGIKETKKLMPDVPQVAVFDTFFHKDMPMKAYLYPMPLIYFTKYGIRKYGFHGTSFRYVSQEASVMLGRPLNELKMILCHLGNGASISAFSNGKSVDTSMGFTPLEGLMMGTRTGDIDSGVVFYLSRELKMSVDEIDDLLNKKSGLLGVSGLSNDMRSIMLKADEGDENCKLAIEMYAYRVKKYIGAYIAVLGGLDALVFTAGVGENNPIIRVKICENLSYLGIDINDKKNSRIVGIMGDISSERSAVRILVIPTDEEKVIALDTVRVCKLQ
ncbi:MAG: acetate kinase [Actinobacteria bacterium]|nr:acetate kinase [Actinomycetota bacterium]